MAVKLNSHKSRPAHRTRLELPALLKHRVVVRRLLGNLLNDVPVFNYSTVFEPKNIHDRHAGVAGFMDEMAVGYDQVALGQDALEFKAE